MRDAAAKRLGTPAAGLAPERTGPTQRKGPTLEEKAEALEKTWPEDQRRFYVLDGPGVAPPGGDPSRSDAVLFGARFFRLLKKHESPAVVERFQKGSWGGVSQYLDDFWGGGHHRSPLAEVFEPLGAYYNALPAPSRKLFVDEILAREAEGKLGRAG
ncbi:MAG: hypothetical protein IT384_03935 [Deltaproteobacteria bacterium]|nr:hypothetical protein [Deltaproteobacteria bacterium]